MGNAWSLLKPVVVLTAICLIVAGLLSGTDMITRDRIAQQKELEAQQARAQVLAGSSSFEEVALGDEQKAQYGAKDLYRDTGGSGWAAAMTARGYGGAMEIMVGIDADGKVAGVVILSSEETPGLGKKTEAAAWLAQYAGQGGQLAVVKGTAGTGEISAVAGATISSRAVTDAVNNAVALVEAAGMGGSQ